MEGIEVIAEAVKCIEQALVIDIVHLFCSWTEACTFVDLAQSIVS